MKGVGSSGPTPFCLRLYATSSSLSSFLRDLDDIPRPDNRRESKAVVIEQRGQGHAVAARDLACRFSRPDAVAPGARLRTAHAAIPGLGWDGPRGGRHHPPAHRDDDSLADA